MHRFLTAIHSFISRRPGFIIALISGVFFLSFGAFSNVEIADEIESGLSDPAALKTYEKFKANFGHEQSISLGFEIGELNRESLVFVFDVLQSLRRIPEIKRVMSILDLLKPYRTRKAFLDNLHDYRIENLKILVRKDPLFQGFLVSPDLKNISLILVPDTNYPEYQRKLYQKLKAILPGIFGVREYHLFGFMYFKERFLEFIANNNALFLSLGFVVCTFLALLFFPDLIILVMILYSITVPTVLTFALYFYNGNKINMFTSPIIPFALIISLNEIIYLVSFFVRDRDSRHADYETLHCENFHKLIRPCLVNTVTTLIGFFALSWNPSANIRLFSVYTSLACFLAYFTSFALVFAFLKLYKPAFSLSEKRVVRFRRVGRILRNTTVRHPRMVVLLTVALLGGMIFFAPPFFKSNGIGDNFQQDDFLVRSFHYFEKYFSGPFFMHVMLSHQDLLSGKYLKAMDAFQERLKTVPGINRIFSIVDLSRKFTEYFSSGPEIPDSPRLIKSIVRFYASRGVAEYFVSPEWNVALIRASISITDDFAIADLGEKILAIARETLPPELQVELTGEVYLNALLQKHILENISWSFALAITMIVVVFFAVFRDLRTAGIALVVNFLPIYASYLTAAFLAIPLNASTMVVGCIMSGLVVDDTLHLLTFYQDAAKSTPVRGIVHLTREMTAPVLYSAMLLALGNAIFMFSEFKPFRYFGTIGTFVVFFGILGDILVLPSLLLLLSRKKPRA